MKRFHQFVLIASFVPLCWLGMMAFHELGHVIAGFLSGGSVTKVVLHPFSISRTDVSPNPHPLIVVWAGPILGILFPLLIWLIVSITKSPGAYLARFFAGFCLIANGAYIGVGSFDQIGDAGEMLRNETPIGVLWLFGLVTVTLGLLFWHRLGSHFGLGESRGRVDKWAAYFSLLLLVLAFATAFAFSPQT